MFRLSRSVALARTLARTAPRRTFALSQPLSKTSKPSTKDDPYPLPLSPEHVSPERDPPKAQADEPIQLDKEVDLSDPGLPFPDPLPRDGESVEQMRARLVYQTRKRGTLESDLLMSTFAKEHMGTMSEFELREFDKVSILVHVCLHMHLCFYHPPPSLTEGVILAADACNTLTRDTSFTSLPSSFLHEYCG